MWVISLPSWPGPLPPLFPRCSKKWVRSMRRGSRRHHPADHRRRRALLHPGPGHRRQLHLALRGCRYSYHHFRVAGAHPSRIVWQNRRRRTQQRIRIPLTPQKKQGGYRIPAPPCSFHVADKSRWIAFRISSPFVVYHSLSTARDGRGRLFLLLTADVFLGRQVSGNGFP